MKSGARQDSQPDGGRRRRPPPRRRNIIPACTGTRCCRFPAKSEFPGTGDKGNGISRSHEDPGAIGSTPSRTSLPVLPRARLDKAYAHDLRSTRASSSNSTEAWDAAHPGRAGQAQHGARRSARLGPDKRARRCSRTGPTASPRASCRPPSRSGRRASSATSSITMWDWADAEGLSARRDLDRQAQPDASTPTARSTARRKRAPTCVPVLDPITNTASADQAAPVSRSRRRRRRKDLPHGPSPYWGDEPIWDGHTSIHNPMIDEKGRVWFTARIRPAANPAFCKEGSDHPSAKAVPLDESRRASSSMYDPKTGKWSADRHLLHDASPVFRRRRQQHAVDQRRRPAERRRRLARTPRCTSETGDEAKSQGWTPLIIDTNGNGKRDALCRANQPVDPDQGQAHHGGVLWRPAEPGRRFDLGPVDGRRVLAHRSARLHHPPVPGSNPSETALAEIYLPPDDGLRAARHRSRSQRRGLDGAVERPPRELRPHASARARSTARTRATGKHCPEGWTLYPIPGPQFKGVTDRAAPTTPITSGSIATTRWARARTCRSRPTNGGEVAAGAGRRQVRQSARAVSDGLLHQERRRPHRRSRMPAGRAAALWTTFGTRAVFHNEGGKDEQPKVYKLQMRPDPLAR